MKTSHAKKETHTSAQCTVKTANAKMTKQLSNICLKTTQLKKLQNGLTTMLQQSALKVQTLSVFICITEFQKCSTNNYTPGRAVYPGRKDGYTMGREYTEAQAKAIREYNKKMCKVTLTIKPEQREQWKNHADKQGKTLTALIADLIEKDIERAKNAKV